MAQLKSKAVDLHYHLSMTILKIVLEGHNIEHLFDGDLQASERLIRLHHS